MIKKQLLKMLLYNFFMLNLSFKLFLNNYFKKLQTYHNKL